MTEQWFKVELQHGGTPPNCGGHWPKDHAEALAEEAASKTDEDVRVVAYTRTVTAVYRRTVNVTVTRTEGGSDATQEEAQGG